MALTWKINNDAREHFGFSSISQPATATPAASDYPTGGYTITPATFGLQSIRGMIYSGADSANSSTNFTTGYLWSYNHATGKLQAFGGAASGIGLAEVSASTDLSAFAVRFTVQGY